MKEAFVAFSTRTAALFASMVIGFWATLHACGIPIDHAETRVLLGVISLAILIPSGPGFFGAYQLSTYYGLAMYFPEAVVLDSGAVFVFVTYAAQLGVTLLGWAVGLALMALYPLARA